MYDPHIHMHTHLYPISAYKPYEYTRPNSEAVTEDSSILEYIQQSSRFRTRVTGCTNSPYNLQKGIAVLLPASFLLITEEYTFP
jgi:hypothetical protein